MRNIEEILSPAELVKKYKLKPNKRLGQNFLVHIDTIKNIAIALEIKDDDLVVEFGSGPGSLGAYISKLGASVIGIEKDKKLIEIAKKEFPNVEWINTDMRDWEFNSDEQQATSNKKLKLVGNLPYYLTSFFLRMILDWNFECAAFMVQKEVGDRILAKPKSSDYSFLSVIIQARTNIEKLFTLGKSSFYPNPEIDSVVLRFLPKKNEWTNNAENLAELCFSHRRQTISKSLKRKFPKDKVEKALEDLKISKTARPQELFPEDYIKLAKLL